MTFPQLNRVLWLLMWCSACGSFASADVIRKFTDEVVKGRIVETNDQQIVFATGAATEEVKTPVPYRDLNSIHFCGKEWDPQFSRLLLDNRGEKSQENSVSIKLRAGNHPIGIVYWSTRRSNSLRVEMAASGMKPDRIMMESLHHYPSGAAPSIESQGFDAEGFLTPVNYANLQAGISVRVFEWPSGEDPLDYFELKGATCKESLVNSYIGTTSFKHADSHFGAYFSGLISIPKDGEYTFVMKSLGNALLWIGREPESVQPFNLNIKADSIHVIGVDGGRWYGALKQLTPTNLIVDVPLGGKLTTMDTPLDMIQEAWRGTVILKEVKIDRSGESTSLDSIYVTKETKPAAPQETPTPPSKPAVATVQRVNGKVLGIEGDSLQIEHMGEKRGIHMDRVQGVVFKGRAPSQPPAQTVLTLSGGIKVPGQLVRVEPQASIQFKTPWGQEFTWPYSNVVRMNIRNGRLTPLTDQQPVTVEQTPYFDHHLPWTTDKSLNGPPLMIGEKRYTRGLCLHSRTVLTYAIDAQYSKFQCDLGLQGETGQGGNAVVRILTDGGVAFENLAVTSASGVQPVSIDLTGKKSLTLEVDFGENFDVCDHVTFGDPRLLQESR